MRRAALLGALLVFVVPAAAGATEIPVTTTADVTSADGLCSLREAVSAANANAASAGPAGECPAGSGSADVIRLRAGTYRLGGFPFEQDNQAGDLDFTGGGSVLLVGLGAGRTTISAGGVDRVLEVLRGARVAVADLRVTGGHAPDGVPTDHGEPGGGILSHGTLALERVTVEGNRAGQGGSQSGLGGDGGGIASFGPLTIVDSVLRGNRAGDGGAGAGGLEGGAGGPAGLGGGLYVNGGAARVLASTFLRNVAGNGGAGGRGTARGGDGAEGGHGGGLKAQTAVHLVNVTMIDNVAGAGGDGGTATVGAAGKGGMGGSGGDVGATTGSTIDFSTFRGGRLGGPGAGAGGRGPRGSGPVLDAITLPVRHSIVRGVGPGGCGRGIRGGTNIAWPRRSGCPGRERDPRLGPLGAHGGPTPTLVPRGGSPARDAAGRRCALKTDQRGVRRPQGKGCDIGAVEVAVARHASAARPAAGLALPRGWPHHFGLGLTDSPGGAAALRRHARFDFRYQYLAGGVNTGQGWSTWNANGAFVTLYVRESLRAHVVPVLTYYMLLQSHPDAPAGEADRDLAHLRSAAVMRAYWRDVRLLLRRAGAFRGHLVVVHVEPDLWGYIEQARGARQPAAVAGAGDPALRGLPDDASGFARAWLRLRDRLAPNVALAWHLSTWGTKEDPTYSKPSLVHMDALAARSARFYRSLRARFDLVFNDIADRDSGFYRHILGNPNTQWGAGDFRRHDTYLRGFTRRVRTPVVLWQLPLGNTGLPDTWDRFRDTRVQWWLADSTRRHLRATRDAGVIALLFGGGADGTTSATTDGGFFFRHARGYYSRGALGLPR